MRVLLVTEPSGGGSGRHVLDLARGLVERNHDVTVAWSPVRAEPNWVRSLESLERVRTVPLDMHRSVGAHDLGAWRALSRMVRETGPYDVLHGHSSKAGALVRMLPPQLPGARVYTPHAFRTMDPGISGRGRLVFGSIERFLGGLGAGVIAVSKAELEHARALGMAADKTVMIVNGVDPVEAEDRATVRDRLELPDGTFAVGFVGRFSDQKDPLRFVRAIRSAQARDPRVVGVMIGDGELADAVREECADGAFRYTGWIDARRVMSGLDLLAMTSRYEAMPYVLLEAASAGLPIVSTEVGGASEVIDQGVNGYVLAQEASPDAIGEAIAQISASGEFQREARKASLARAARYSNAAMVDATLQAYARFGARS